MITEGELDAMEQRCNAATEGPWDRRLSAQRVSGRKHEYVCSTVKDDDANFIANARTDLPRLINAYRALLDYTKRC